MIVKDENMVAAFVNTQQAPIKIRHICYFTASNGEDINLLEVFEATYPHPEAPEASIPLTDIRLVKTINRSSYHAAHLVLMEAQQKVCRTIEVRR